MNTNLIGISGKIGSGKDTMAEIIKHLCSSPGLSNGTIAHFVQQHSVMANKGEYQVKKFAGKLKQIASILTGIPVDKFENQEFKKENLGEEWESVFILQTGEGIDNALGPFKNVETAQHFLKLAGLEHHPNVSNDVMVRHMTVREMLQKLGTEAMRNGLHNNVWVNALFADYRAPKMSEDFPSKWLITDVRFENEAEAIKERGGILVRIKRSSSESSGSHPSETALDHYKFDYTIDNNGSMVDLVAAVRSFLEAYDIISSDTYAD